MALKSPRCRIVPQAGEQVSVEVDHREVARWHFGSQYPRPFFFPVNGPAGETLTRMGHPGAANHDHHRSIWFAHHKVLGIDFWGDNTTAQIRQTQWLCYQDGDIAVMAVELKWFDGHDPAELLTQELVAAFHPQAKGEWLLELQSKFTPRSEMLEFGQTNFGFLAVRMAKTISSHFGEGTITDSEGRVGEPEIFGKAARWMDYSGPVVHPKSTSPIQGVTYFDHPVNPSYPMKWHAREDGWMGASVCRDGPVLTTKTEPLRLRFLLHIHNDAVDSAAANKLSDTFAAWRPWQVTKSTAKHQSYEATRE